MHIRTLTQPLEQFGEYLGMLLRQGNDYRRIVFVSAFVGLRAILRLREQLLYHKQRGCQLVFNVGIDLGGTSKQVLEELARWDCETYVTHNPAPRATFHPKLYLLESISAAHVIIGSNNLTDGGFYTNYEAAACHEFELPSEQTSFEDFIRPLHRYLQPHGDQVQRLTDDLIAILHKRGQLLSEAQVRRKIVRSDRPNIDSGEDTPPSPFPALLPTLPPLLPTDVRHDETISETVITQGEATGNMRTIPEGTLVWSKRLPRTDALQVNPGSHPVGGVRLTQAGFERPLGHRIDQTTYFRNLFQDSHWAPEPGKHEDQEHAFVAMRVFIRGQDHGIHNFEITHKPSGEAGQANYTTQLRWGREFAPTVINSNLTGLTFQLYETNDDESPFLLIID